MGEVGPWLALPSASRGGLPVASETEGGIRAALGTRNQGFHEKGFFRDFSRAFASGKTSGPLGGVAGGGWAGRKPGALAGRGTGPHRGGLGAPEVAGPFLPKKPAGHTAPFEPADFLGRRGDGPESRRRHHEGSSRGRGCLPCDPPGKDPAHGCRNLESWAEVDLGGPATALGLPVTTYPRSDGVLYSDDCQRAKGRIRMPEVRGRMTDD